MENNLAKRIKKLLEMVEMTEETECDCSHVYDIMDEVAEAVAAGHDLSAVMPDIDRHLSQCGCCQAEVAALQRVLEKEE